MTPLDAEVFSLDPPRLVLWRCVECAALHFPRRAVCATCGHDELERVTGGAAGHIFTYTIIHAPTPGYLGQVPYAVGVVELEDGLRVEANLHAADLGALSVGQRVAAEAVALEGETGIVSYTPA